ncbi:MAG: alpha/beta fold hydrolase [Pararhodobacter sp.]|nr:alpha/beta fold hydrolase [Pararhodobacter sp.]
MVRQVVRIAVLAAFIMPGHALADSALAVLGAEGNTPRMSLSDGDMVRLSVTLPAPVNAAQEIPIRLEGISVGNCIVPARADSCVTTPIRALGWAWSEAGEPAPSRHLVAGPIEAPIAETTVSVDPRPVVLVHGLMSSAETWDGYKGPDGFLAPLGLSGFAVGDGQAEGLMNTGSVSAPFTATNTIDQNAEELARYIAGVRQQTGAEMVDLVVHSMGGLIARHYIARIMQERDVAQLIMLGTPNSGSNCSVLGSALGLLQPAAMQLRSNYVSSVFNPQTDERRGIRFFTLAGTPVQRTILSPCTSAPHDLVVSLESALDVTDDWLAEPVYHTDMTASAGLFTDVVAPLLRRGPSAFLADVPQVPHERGLEESAFSPVFTGRVAAGEAVEHVIHIDHDVVVASFGIYDPSRSVRVVVRGATGNVIELDEITHGFTVIEDPATLLYLGYGFENPRPGPWRVTIEPGPDTPPEGTDYSIIVRYVGGGGIDARLDRHLVGRGHPVNLSAQLRLGEGLLAHDMAEVTLIRPNGEEVALEVPQSGDGLELSVVPDRTGAWGIDVRLRHELADGFVVERADYLAFRALRRSPRGAD